MVMSRLPNISTVTLAIIKTSHKVVRKIFFFHLPFKKKKTFCFFSNPQPLRKLICYGHLFLLFFYSPTPSGIGDLFYLLIYMRSLSAHNRFIICFPQSWIRCAFFMSFCIPIMPLKGSQFVSGPWDLRVFILKVGIGNGVSREEGLNINCIEGNTSFDENDWEFKDAFLGSGTADCSSDHNIVELVSLSILFLYLFIFHFSFMKS